jgi:hypothetical protein
MPGIEVDLPGLHGAGFTGPEPARVHQREERDRLPSPRGLHLDLYAAVKNNSISRRVNR